MQRWTALDDADVLWERGAELYQTAPWAFTPAETVRRSLTELARTLSAPGISQRHLTDVAAWRLIAESLVAEPDSAVSRVIHDGHGDAGRLMEELAIKPPKGPGRFPLLSGPKVGPMWVRMQAYPGGATISDLASIPVAVDVQVRKVAEYLGLTKTAREPEINHVRGPGPAFIRTVLACSYAGGGGTGTTSVAPEAVIASWNARGVRLVSEIDHGW